MSQRKKMDTNLIWNLAGAGKKLKDTLPTTEEAEG
jgi:hypothetical protein